MENSKWHISLAEKLYFFISWIILVLSLLLTLTSYREYRKKVDSYNFMQTERLAAIVAVDIPADLIENLWKYISTEEFRQIRDKALESEDESIIENWMREQPGVAEGSESCLYYDYLSLCNVCRDYTELYEVLDVYVQYKENGNTYNLADPLENLLYIGSVEEPVEEFAKYSDNTKVPPTTYTSPDRGMLCTACEPILSRKGGQSVGLVCVDISMNVVMMERQEFMVNSLAIILIEFILALTISMLLIKHTVTKPVGMLTKAAKGFASSDSGYKKEDVISLPIESRDEIGDLYHEIRSMQGRIVDYTDNITRITAERERVDTELRMASDIQASMLPSHFPAFPDRNDFDLYASMNPAKEVGGDFYDFFMIDDDHLCLLIADVSDKGVPAALFMMSAKILINYRAREGGSPDEILTAVNMTLSKNNKSKMFVTVWMGILELSTGVMKCTNAGHENPIIRGKDGVFRVFEDKHSFMVGAMAKAKFHGYEITLNEGDAVFVYTDGVPEAKNRDGEFYGMERLEAALNTDANAVPERLLENVRNDVARFVEGAVQFDDLTMLCIEYKKKYQGEADNQE